MLLVYEQLLTINPLLSVQSYFMVAKGSIRRGKGKEDGMLEVRGWGMGEGGTSQKMTAYPKRNI